MAARVLITHPKAGTVSRRKLEAAAKLVAKGHIQKTMKSGAFTNAHTASGSGKIAFVRPMAPFVR